MRVVCISDTHNQLPKLSVPDGDLLIHAGDATARGSLDEIARFDRDLGRLPHRHKVVIAGNHDWAFQKTPEAARALIKSAVYLEDEAVTLGGLRIYGSPWQPWFLDWAFNLARGPEIAAKWDLIPAGIDVLVTHGPPLGHGDFTTRGEAVGCADLLEAVRRVRPRLHVFGHIHEGYGMSDEGGCRMVNASSCTVAYKPTQPPLVIEI